MVSPTSQLCLTAPIFGAPKKLYTFSGPFDEMLLSSKSGGDGSSLRSDDLFA